MYYYPYGQSKKKSSWPAGADGALVINNATITLDATNVPIHKDYSSISITNNGILNILGGNWVSIGCLGSFTVDATSKIQAISNGDTATNGTPINYSDVAPDGMALNSNIIQSAGGAGGGSAQASPG